MTTLKADLLRRFGAWLVHPRLPRHLVIVSLIVTAPGLFVGWQVDDWFQQTVLQGLPAPEETMNPYVGMFDFFNGDPDRAQMLREHGFAPWWLADGFRARFLRPVAIATHVFDDFVARGNAMVAHAHSLAWSALVVLLATLLFRRIHGATAMAGLAAVIYALDEGRGIPTGWIANRSALVALVFGLLTLLAHDRWRRDGWKPGLFIAPILLGVGLFGAEAALATTAYLFGYTVFVDRGPLVKRLARLLPFAAVVIAWRVLYDAWGFGASGSGLYLDPVAQPGRFGAAVMQRLPILLAAQWTSLPSIVFNFAPPPWNTALLALAGLTVATVGALLWPLLRASSTARMWATGMVLAVLPVCATFPANRLLVFVGIGAAGLMAELAQRHGFIARSPAENPENPVRDEADPARTPSAPGHSSMPARSLVGGLLVVSVLLAPPALAHQTWIVHDLADLLFNSCDRAIPDDPSIRDKAVFFVNSNALCVGYSVIRRPLEKRHAPRSARIFASAAYEVHVTGVDSHTLRITTVGGFFARPVDQLLRNTKDTLPIGGTVDLGDVRVKVVEHTPDGLIGTIEVKMRDPLADKRHIWLATRDHKPTVFMPPQPRQKVVLPAAF